MADEPTLLSNRTSLTDSLVSRRTASRRSINNSELDESSGYIALELPSPGSGNFKTLVNGRTTEEALEKCKKEVLSPYQFFLRLLGWQPWIPSGGVVTSFKERGFKFLNVIYPIFVTCLLIAGYFTQFGACYSRDHPMYNIPNDSEAVRGRYCNSSNDLNPVTKRPFCSHAYSKYLFSDIIHFIGFLYGMYIFRWRENEELEMLMQKTFIQTGGGDLHYYLSQKKLSTAVQAIFYSGIAWIFVNFIASVLGLFGRLVDCTWTEPWRLGFVSWMDVASPVAMWILIVVMWIGFLAFDLVNIAVTVNYTTQCQLIIVLVRGLVQKVHDKTITLQNAIKEFHEAGKAVDALNRQMAIVISIMEFNFVSHSILCLHSFYVLRDSFDLLSNSHAEVLFIFSAVLDFILWTAIALFPVIQAARVTSACQSPIKTALEIRTRPFQYQETKDAEFDSFITFLNAQNKKAKLFRIPVVSHYLWALGAAAIFVLLLLVELEIINVDV
ncbi:uncharacterized protein [Oscarella lobularis]|uniref:uncharacterized protein n=1 Tax=Oscarella lobularis TaxID=121494 RepID=UPI003313EC7D